MAGCMIKFNPEIREKALAKKFDSLKPSWVQLELFQLFGESEVLTIVATGVQLNILRADAGLRPSRYRVGPMDLAPPYGLVA